MSLIKILFLVLLIVFMLLPVISTGGNIYYSLQKNIDSNVPHSINNQFGFKYHEKHISGNLSYSIYDEYRNDVTPTINLTKTPGWNFYLLDVSTLTLGTYVLEVKDENDELYLLKFKK